MPVIHRLVVRQSDQAVMGKSKISDELAAPVAAEGYEFVTVDPDAPDFANYTVGRHIPGINVSGNAWLTYDAAAAAGSRIQLADNRQVLRLSIAGEVLQSLQLTEGAGSTTIDVEVLDGEGAVDTSFNGAVTLDTTAGNDVALDFVSGVSSFGVALSPARRFSIVENAAYRIDLGSGSYGPVTVRVLGVEV